LSRNRKELPISSHTKRNTSYIGRYVHPKGRPEGARRDGEQSYNLIVPVKGGEPQGFPQGSGHGIHWREGGSKRTNLLKGDITRS